MCIIVNVKRNQNTTGESRKGKNKMTIKEMKAYIAEELKEEYEKLLKGEENNYEYLFMIANDLGLTK